jgi:glycosyltransferase involved in cell wall biosynthesis
VVEEKDVMTDEGGVWVGLLDMDDVGPVIGVSGPVCVGYRQARVLIRMHRAPLGQVSIPTQPMETLTARVRTAAETTLVDALRRHAHWDKVADKLGVSCGWTVQAACPHHFPTHNGAGVTIIVCTRDRTEGLLECLSTLQQVAYDPIEIIVVDNAPSGNATREAVTAIAQDDPRIRYTCESRPGLSRARNHGLVHARYDIVAFTDDDTLVDSGWPSAVAAGFVADPGAMCLTGLVASRALDTGSQRYFDSRYSWGEAFEPRRYDLAAHRHPSRLYPFSAGIFGTGANFAVRRSALAGLGGFDPLLGAGSPGRGGEDLDMFLRIILAGGRICYLPSALVWHRHRADTQALSEQIYSYGYGLGAYVAKHLLNRQLPTGILGQGLRQVGTVVGRMRLATQESQLRAGGRRLGLTEARGVMAGALCYYRASRRASSVSSGV